MLHNVNAMKPNLPNIVTFFFVFFAYPIFAQTGWSEYFTETNRGVWGDDDGKTIHESFDGVSNWSLDYSQISLSNPDDYAKTVSTSGGRFECRDINGEVVWRSEQIDISNYKNVNIQLLAKETGSGANEQNKYLKAFYRIDESSEIPFSSNSENMGNWGEAIAEQSNVSGQKLQIVVYMNNHYSSDKVILDEIIVSAVEEPLPPIYAGDVILNEVLFNPFPEGSDYVEIYNVSEKEISAHQLCLASRDKNMELTQIYSLSETRTAFQASSYLALTKDTNGVFPFYNIKCFDCFLEMEKFPSYNNDEDIVVLLNEEMEVIDEFSYTDKMHAPLLADEEGISLERKLFATETSSMKNWYSASSESGYGTPGYKNSQVKNEELVEPLVVFSPESFSPNSDGYNDEYIIQYQLEKSGYYSNISIFDAAGRLVIQLRKNEILGTAGEITWNGEDETGQRLRLGVYVVVVEIFDLVGNIYHFKDGVVLTDILE